MSESPYKHGKFGEFGKYDKFAAESAIADYVIDPTTENLRVAVEENVRLAAWFTYRVLDKKRVSNLTDDEIYSVCCASIEKAVRKFDPRFGTAFSTYATRIMLNSITSANYRETVQAIRFEASCRATINVERIADYREGCHESVEISEAVGLAEDWAKKNLSKRLMIVFEDRRNGVLLRETAKKLRVSRERVRQMHCKIIERMTEELDFLKGVDHDQPAQS